MSGPMQWSPSTGRFTPALTLASDGSVHVGDDEVTPAVVMSQPVSPSTSAVGKPEPKAQKKVKPTNIVALAKARLKDVKQELRRMKALEKECAELERLISAAEDTKPRAVVRELKRSTG